MFKVDDICKQLAGFITENYLEGELGIEADTSLIDLNIIDSASFFDIVDYIRDVFKVNLPLKAINAENFSTLQALSSTVFQYSKQE